MAASSPITIVVAAVAAYLFSQLGILGKGTVDVCPLIVTAVSSASRVSYPDDPQFEKDTNFFSLFDVQTPKCTVEPATTADLSIILGIVGSHRTPFAVRSGGHQGAKFSSTTGVLIAMTRFSQVTYHEESQTAEVGSGLLWQDVYAALKPHGVTVLGGRISGIGVGGFLLGGGYSFFSNQHGLASDNVKALELVKPDGNVVQVTNESEPELFFGLRGGYNNFGIVTSFTLNTYPLNLVWAGDISYTTEHIQEFNAALVKYYAEVSDPKAMLLTSYNNLEGAFSISATMFYDGPSPSPGIFDSFLSIPSVANNAETKDYVTFINSTQFSETMGDHRTLFTTVSVTNITLTLMAVIWNETEFWSAALASKSLFAISLGPEPLLSTMLLQPDVPPSAYPPDRTFAYTNVFIYFSWDDEKYDADFNAAIRASAKRVTEAAIEEGQDIEHASLYPNYALHDTPPDKIYGENLARLRKLKKELDPENVMGLAGGFKF